MRHGFDCSQSFEPLSVFPKAHEDSPPTDSPSSKAPSCGGTQASLRELIPTARIVGGPDLIFDEIANRGTDCAAGQLVVYRIGEDCPNRLVADALARGAAGILTEQLLPCPLPQCVVGDVELAIAEIRARQLESPDRKLLTVGVMGSAGKTSTTLLISSLLRASGIRTAYVCDLGDSDGVVQSTGDKRLAVGAPLIEHLSDSVDAGSRAAIIELNEEQARHGRYDSVQFDILVVAGSANCSSDFGPSGLQCLLDRVTSDGVVIAPGDDTRATRAIRENECNLLTYGSTRGSDLAVRLVQQSGGISTLLLNHQNTTAAMETTLCGESMAANHAAAAMVGLLIAVPLEDIAERLGTLREIPGRGQRLSDMERATVVVDAGGTPERVTASLRDCRAMKSAGRGQLWCILSIDETMSDETLAQYGRLLEKYADQVVVTARTESQSKFLQRSHYILDGVQKCAAFRLVANQRRGVEWAVEQASPADTIVMITSQGGQSAKEQRHEVERIKRWLNPPQLKVFNGS
ncbi:MAG: UDP-N-acetylmuramoyl-L-alanyl-D-glutamate--2,6-diaminopimelate ligase [Planctomycetota bacterium]